MHSIYDIIRMGAGMCLYALYIMLSKWELVFFWLSILWYQIDSSYVSECSLHDIIKKGAGMCLKSLYMLLLKWEMYIGKRFIRYYQN